MDLWNPNANIAVRPTEETDVFTLADNLREDDVQEVRDISGLDPLAALGYGFVESDRCLTILFKGVPAGMMGVVPSKQAENPRLGHVWLLGSEQLALFSHSIVRYARPWLRELVAGYDVIGNLVSLRNPAHVRFLTHIGARIVERHREYGPGKVPALQFVFDADDLQEIPPSV